MKHVMIDIETMASSKDAAVISIGLAEFNPITGEIVSTLEVRNTLKAQRELGRRFDPATVEWWLTQSKPAQMALLAKPRYDDPAKMMKEVDTYLNGICSSQWDLALWAKGPSFDLTICRDLAEMCEVRWKGHFSREYCVRTMLMIAKANQWDDILAMEPTIAHGALSDAEHQARQVMEVMKRLKR
tara:strand:- start:32023 stop:32577 length:555 start_codon:yes stop_codon:yes gene_type:complete